MYTSKQMSKIQHCHFECQKYQFILYILKYGEEKAIELMQPKRYGHYTISQEYNAKLIDNIDLLRKEINKEIEYNREPTFTLKLKRARVDLDVAKGFSLLDASVKVFGPLASELKI